VTPRECLAHVIRPACALAGPRFVDPRAEVALLAIALQETGLATRRQQGGGPGRGYVQFERAGIAGVLTHSASAVAARALLRTLAYPATITPAEVHGAVEHNDLLCLGLARLLLFTVPAPLPALGDRDETWSQYVAAWRPGAVTGGGSRAAAARRRWTTNYAKALDAMGAA